MAQMLGISNKQEDTKKDQGSGQRIRRILEVKANDDFTLECEMENGEFYLYDMFFINTTEGEVTKPLKNIRMFQQSLLELKHILYHAALPGFYFNGRGGMEKYKTRRNLRNPVGWFYNAMKSEGGYVASSDGFISEEEKIKKDGVKLREQESMQKQKQKELELERKRLEELETAIKAKKDKLEEAGIDTTKPPLPNVKNVREASFRPELN